MRRCMKLANVVSMSSATVCEITATVPTGLEPGAAEECREVLGREARLQRGRIAFDLLSVEELTKVDHLRSIDNYCVTVKHLPEFCKEESTVLQRLETLPFGPILDWDVPLSAWRHCRDHLQVCSYTVTEESYVAKEHGSDVQETPELEGQPEIDPATHGSQDGAQTDSKTDDAVLKPDLEAAESSASEPTVSHLSTTPPGSVTAQTHGAPQQISFRVTCNRIGRKHSFSSVEAASHFGAGLARYFGWKVQLKNPDLEVLLSIANEDATVRIALSRESKHKRNIAHFGPTTLRSTIAYGMLRLASIKPGDVVIDPMCGGGSITIEGSLAWPSTYHLAGDLHKLASPRTVANLEALHGDREKAGKVKADVLRWDVCSLPLKTACVDVIVTDMPFGKKSGSKVANWELYPQALEELGRVCRPGSARAVLLTHDNKVLSRALRSSVLWNRHRTYWVNIGGLNAGVYTLNRTDNAFNQ